MATSCAGTCAFCSIELGRGPRYVLDFRACAACVRRHDRTGSMAPLALPQAPYMDRRTLPPGHKHSCHLCQDKSVEALIGTLGCELCEGCHHAVPAAEVQRCFTAAMTPLKTGSDPADQPLCDACGCASTGRAFLLPTFACGQCSQRPAPCEHGVGPCTNLPKACEQGPGLLRGIVRRLPCSMLPDRSTPEPEDIYRRVAAHLLEVPVDQLTCSGCCRRVVEDVHVLNYVLCARCQAKPSQEACYQFKSMFVRRTAGFLLADAQYYLDIPTPPNNYTLLGKGGFGAVFKVKGRSTGRIYAKKEVKVDRSSRKLAEQEARMMQDCCHPNIVECAEAFYQSQLSCLYILLEFAPRGDLHREISTRKRVRNLHFEEASIWGTLRQVSSGLAYLHLRGIVHRDLKPNNVLVFEGPHGSVTSKITDFGLARVQSAERRLRSGGTSSTASNNGIAAAGVTSAGGSPGYMAPEVVDAYMEGQETHPKGAEDIWSLGVIVWELAYLQHPFASVSRHVEWWQVDYRDVPPPPRLPKRSADLHQLIIAMMAPRPRDRPTVEEVLAAAKARTWPLQRPVVGSLQSTRSRFRDSVGSARSAAH